MRNPPKPQVPGLCGWDKQDPLVELSVSRCDRHAVILKVILSVFVCVFFFQKCLQDLFTCDSMFPHLWSHLLGSAPLYIWEIIYGKWTISSLYLTTSWLGLTFTINWVSKNLFLARTVLLFFSQTRRTEWPYPQALAPAFKCQQSFCSSEMCTKPLRTRVQCPESAKAT